VKAAARGQLWGHHAIFELQLLQLTNTYGNNVIAPAPFDSRVKTPARSWQAIIFEYRPESNGAPRGVHRLDEVS